MGHHSSISGKVLQGHNTPFLFLAASPAIVIYHHHSSHRISMVISEAQDRSAVSSDDGDLTHSSPGEERHPTAQSGEELSSYGVSFLLSTETTGLRNTSLNKDLP